ncbi:hypothetical protein [Reyranella sp.]|uniref:hypothetical protein n=1 Tax=Reyranella sp. TaxID=1929291 RepID=UPI003BAD7A36
MSGPTIPRGGARFLAERIGQDALAIAELIDLLAEREARLAELESRLARFEAGQPDPAPA